MFDRIKSKLSSRRLSEPSLFDPPGLSFASRRALTSTNRPIVTNDDNHHLIHHMSLISMLRALSVSNGASSEVAGHLRLVLKRQAKELIKQETSHVVGKKLDTLLADLGLQLPIPLATTNNATLGPPSKLIRCYLSNTNDSIYLPAALLASFTYDDVENGGLDIPMETGLELEGILENDARAAFDLDHDSSLGTSPNTKEPGIKPFRSPNYLCTKIDSDTPIPHVFAFIVELTKETVIREVKFDFQLCVLTLWPTGDLHNHYHQKEKFKIGALEWNTTMNDADYYINTQNSNDAKIRKIDPSELAQRTKKYRLVNVRDLADDTDPLNNPRKSVDVSSSHPAFSDAMSVGSAGIPETYKAGLYVFLLPLAFPPDMPASVTSINGSLVHRLTMSMAKTSDKLNRKTKVFSYYNLPMVRTPPSLANSMADKPIYVNRIWNDAMHYIIIFPKKYVPLGSEHTINIKLIPLMKDVVLKRIKFNVLERITYVSRDLRKEYEYDGDDPFLVRNMADKKNCERVVHLCELKTKYRTNYSNTAEPFKEEVIKCPDNNLLFSCYEPKSDFNLDDPLAKPERSTMIASPLDINIALPFLTSKADKGPIVAKPEETVSSSHPRRSFSAHRDSALSGHLWPSSPIIGSLETHISHLTNEATGLSDEMDVLKLDSSALLDDQKHNKDGIHQGVTSVQRALAPDSNFRHIQISHRLQVSFRISKPDPKDNNRMHHYEVVVDTPLILLSARCDENSMQLPKYDEIDSDVVVPRPPPVKREITFRTPSYNKNGVSIEPLNPEGNDRLPSFEEAISASASPIMRSFSVGEDALSRANSISHVGPAPLYESSVPDSNGEYVPTLLIDDLVIDSPTPTQPRKTSTLKASLGSSFAPSSLHSSDRSDAILSANSNLGRESNCAEDGDPLSVLTSDSASEALTNDTSSLSSSNDLGGRHYPKNIGDVSPSELMPVLGCESLNGEDDDAPIYENAGSNHSGGLATSRRIDQLTELGKVLSVDLGDPKQMKPRRAY